MMLNTVHLTMLYPLLTPILSNLVSSNFRDFIYSMFVYTRILYQCVVNVFCDICIYMKFISLIYFVFIIIIFVKCIYVFPFFHLIIYFVSICTINWLCECFFDLFLTGKWVFNYCYLGIYFSVLVCTCTQCNACNNIRAL